MAMIVSFSPVTNRETFEQSFTLTDYETGEAIDLSGVTAIKSRCATRIRARRCFRRRSATVS